MLSNNFLSYLAAIALAVGFGTYYQPEKADLGAVLQGVASQARPARQGLQVALGANVCVDLIVHAADVLGRTDTESGSGAVVQPADHAFLRSREDADATFAYYFAAGAAAERSCDAAVFEGLVGKAARSSSARRFLGGNAGLMARKLANMGVQTLLGGPIGPDAAAILPPSVKLATAQLPSDEVHIIAEYARDEAIAGYAGAAPRANRFIITADAGNTNVDAMLATLKAADAARAHLLVVAGLHMLEPLADEARRAALGQLAEGLKGRKGGYLVHIELASSADAAWTAAIASQLFPLVDSVGFNEQEGAFLFESLGGQWSVTANGTATATATGQGKEAGTPHAMVAGGRKDVAGPAPKAVTVAGVLRFLLEAFPSLSRLHFHALPMHVTAHRWGNGVQVQAGPSRKTAAWLGGVGPVAAGSMTATTEACRASVEELAGGAPERLMPTGPLRFNVADPRAGGAGGALAPVSVVRSKPEDPVVAWTWAAAGSGSTSSGSGSNVGSATSGASGSPIHFHLAPVVGCRKPLSTVGLGDAISAAGLAADVSF